MRKVLNMRIQYTSISARITCVSRMVVQEWSRFYHMAAPLTHIYDRYRVIRAVVLNYAMFSGTRCRII